MADPEVTSITLGELRQLSPFRMIATLRAASCARVLVPLEDETSKAVAPVLKLLSLFIPARQYFIIGPDFEMSQFSRAGAPFSLMALLLGTIMGFVAKWRASVETSALVRRKPRAPHPVGRELLFLNANLWFGLKAGGSVGHISGVVNGFAESKFEVEYAAVGGRLLVKKDVSYHPIRAPSSFGFPWEANYYAFNYSAVKQVAVRQFRRRPRAIYQRLSVANFSGVLLARKFNVPLIIEYNGSEAWVAKNWGRPLRYQRLAERCEVVCLKHADLVVTISEVLRDELISRGVAPDRIVTYPNCIDPEMFNPDRFTTHDTAALRDRLRIPREAVVVTFVGTFGQWHGAPILAAAAREILERHSLWTDSNRVHFLFVGDGLRMHEVREALGPFVSASRVTLAGLVPQDQAPLHLAASDIVCSPHIPNPDGSRFFGSPTKLFEYMAMGKPIIASELDQIADVFSGSVRVSDIQAVESDRVLGSSALLAAPGSSADIVKAIMFLAENPGARTALGQNARKLALRRYTWKVHVDAIVDGMDRWGLVRS